MESPVSSAGRVEAQLEFTEADFTDVGGVLVETGTTGSGSTVGIDFELRSRSTTSSSSGGTTSFDSTGITATGSVVSTSGEGGNLDGSGWSSGSSSARPR